MSREDFQSRVTQLDKQKQKALRRKRKAARKIRTSTGIWNGWRFLLGVFLSALASALVFRVVQTPAGAQGQSLTQIDISQPDAIIMLGYLGWFLIVVLGVIGTFFYNYRKFSIPMCSSFFLGAIFMLLAGLVIMNIVDCGSTENCVRGALRGTFN